MRLSHRLGATLAFSFLGCGASVGDGAQPEDTEDGGAGGVAPTAAPGGGGIGGLGGRAAADGGSSVDGPVVPSPGARGVELSEIMYHPVLENALEDDHEFIEIHNRTAATVGLDGWKIAGTGGLAFTFPAGASIGAGQYLVIAKKRTALLAVARYALDPAAVIGDYTGELDNGGARVALLDASGAIVSAVAYDDEFPWPIGADALGAGESWLAAPARPLENHQYLGISLERVSFTVPADEAANWVPSPLDGATPGRANAGAAVTPPPIVELLTATPQGAQGLIRSQHSVDIFARLSQRGGVAVKDVRVEYFVDLLDRTDEARMTVPMTAAADGLRAPLPPRPDGSIVRYRVLADRGTGSEVMTPRPSDPFAWHAYFVDPASRNTTRTYHLFIAPADWGRMSTNISGGPNSGCRVNPTWDQRVPAVFVHDGRVYDVQARYQGSRFNRHNGVAIAWPHPGPATSVRVLSWKINFPRYRELGGERSINLNKLNQACPGVENHVESALFWAAGIPTSRHSFARVNINGGFYQYMMEVHPVSERTMRRLEDAGKPVGDLFKADGPIDNQGPWAKADGHQIQPLCGFTSLQRYVTSYERHTHEWKGDRGHAELIKLVDGYHAAKAAGLSALRAYLDRSFDRDKLLTAFAIRNWAGSWDDYQHNYYLYRRPSDGKWLIMYYDFDLDFGGSAQGGGGMRTPATTLFVGEEGHPLNTLGLVNHFRDGVLKAFREEFVQKVNALSTTLLAPANLNLLVGEYGKAFSVADWNDSAARPCDPASRMDRVRNWARDRHAFLMKGVR